MQYTLSELKQSLFGTVQEVYQIFQNFFGEQFTDLQLIPDSQIIQLLESLGISEHEGYYIGEEGQWDNVKRNLSSAISSILVWWPSVTVSNENDRSINIYDLYAKIELTTEGRIPYENRGFTLNRTTFPELQYYSGYLHSHIPGFRGVPSFSNPCLGTSPIINTIMDLKNEYDETTWMLFCQELSLCVTVESLSGGPYIRLEYVGHGRLLPDYRGYDDGWRSYSETTFIDCLPYLEEFTVFYLQHGHLAFNYKNDDYEVGMLYFDFIIDISNSFIDFINDKVSSGNLPLNTPDHLFEKGLLVKCLAVNGKFYRPQELTEAQFNDEGHPMFMFKGEMKNLHIICENNEGASTSIVIKHGMAMYILTNILKIINYRYRNAYYRKQIGDSSSVNAAPSYKTVIYI